MEIEFPEDDPELIHQMLLYLYLGNSRTPTSLVAEDGAPTMDLIRDAKLYTTAEKFEIGALKKKIRATYAHCFDAKNFDTVALPLADTFAAAFECIYRTTADKDGRLRDMVKTFAWAYRAYLMPREDFKMLLRNSPGFAKNMTEAMVEESVILGTQLPQGQYSR
ncbi:hypothetical protein MMC25_001436 [Agyrium rufum]|nr:hypothetical protein [Agyrium rufum]